MKVISDYELIDKKCWNDFVFKHPSGNIFQTPGFYQVYQNTKYYEPLVLGVYSNTNKILGILVSVVQKESNGIIGFFSARSIIFGGPLVYNSDEEVLDLLLSSYKKIINKKAIYTQVRNCTILDEDNKNIFAKNGFVFKDHLNILIDLKFSLDTLWKGIKRNRKDGINKASKQGFLFEACNHLNDISTFYYLLTETYKNIRLPCPDISFFEQINNHLTDYCKWFILYHNDIPKIILCALVYKKNLYAFSIGISQEDTFKKLRPVDLFYWEIIKWAVNKRLKYFDWMGAGHPQKEYGVRKFKLQYGGRTLNPGRYEIIHKNELYKIGKLGLGLWQNIQK